MTAGASASSCTSAWAEVGECEGFLYTGVCEHLDDSTLKHTPQLQKPQPHPSSTMLRQRRQQQQDETELVPLSATSSSDSMWMWTSTPASNALTSNDDEIWNAGRFPPAHIRFEFDSAVQCTRIDLLPCMKPATGAVVHEIHTGSDVYRFSGQATDHRWIRVELNPNGQRVKAIEIHTLESSSWVAWRRVRFWTVK